MAVELTQRAVLKIMEGQITVFNSEDDEIVDKTTYDEGNGAVIKLAIGLGETELPITGMEESKLMYLKCDKAVKFKAVAPGGVVGSTTEYTLTPNIASFLGFEVEKLFVRNTTGDLATLVQGYVGTHV